MGNTQRTKSICKNGWGAVKTSRLPATNIKRKEVFTMEEVRNEVQNEEPEKRTRAKVSVSSVWRRGE